MNENQKKTTERYRSNFDNIFGKKNEPTKTPQATDNDEADVASGVHPSDTTS